MALSNRLFDQTVENFLKTHPQKNYFDIGTGAGKYGKMIKKLFPKANVVGIEASQEYIDKYNVVSVYDKLYHQRVEEFIRKNVSFSTDIVMMGDLLEHLLKSDGLDVLHFFMYRSKYIVVLFPTQFVQYDLKGVASEAHNSVWDRTDFKQFKHSYQKNGHMNLVIINGYLGDSKTIINNG